MSSSPPLLSICCITYNHEEFIREALDGFLIQQTSFLIEIVIHDDASTDSTTRILHEYQEKYPHLIKLILQTENQYSKRGFGFISDLFAQAQGKYIALCEGDDYWTDSLKLQKQVDFLEANLDFAICFHKVKILEAGQIVDDYLTSDPPLVSTIVDLAKGNYIHTPSCVFRNNTSKILGLNFPKSPLGDYYIHMMNAVYGDIFCIDEVMAIYRVHSTSTFSSQSMTCKISRTIKAIEIIFKDLHKKDFKVRHNLIDAHIKQTMNIYSQLLLATETDSKSTNTTFEPNEYRLRIVDVLVNSEKDMKEIISIFYVDRHRLKLIENLIESREKIIDLKAKNESIKWLIIKLSSEITNRIRKLFAHR